MNKYNELKDTAVLRRCETCRVKRRSRGLISVVGRGTVTTGTDPCKQEGFPS